MCSTWCTFCFLLLRLAFVFVFVEVKVDWCCIIENEVVLRVWCCHYVDVGTRLVYLHYVVYYRAAGFLLSLLGWLRLLSVVVRVVCLDVEVLSSWLPLKTLRRFLLTSTSVLVNNKLLDVLWKHGESFVF